MLCSICRMNDGLPYTCKFCSQDFCSKHRLPESHDCEGLRKWKEEKNEGKLIYPPFQKERKDGMPVSRETLMKAGIILLLVTALVIFVVMK